MHFSVCTALTHCRYFVKDKKKRKREVVARFSNGVKAAFVDLGRSVSCPRGVLGWRLLRCDHNHLSVICTRCNMIDMAVSKLASFIVIRFTFHMEHGDTPMLCCKIIACTVATPSYSVHLCGHCCEGQKHTEAISNLLTQCVAPPSPYRGDWP